MPSLRITAVAALATAALVVPATASAKDEAATAAAIGNPTLLQVNLPSESEWTFCATEGARCEFTGTEQVRYGGMASSCSPGRSPTGSLVKTPCSLIPRPGL